MEQVTAVSELANHPGTVGKTVEAHGAALIPEVFSQRLILVDLEARKLPQLIISKTALTLAPINEVTQPLITQILIQVLHQIPDNFRVASRDRITSAASARNELLV